MMVTLCIRLFQVQNKWQNFFEGRWSSIFNKLVSAGSSGPIKFKIYYRESKNDRPITYKLSIWLDNTERPYVKEERLRQRRKGESRGWPYFFLLFRKRERCCLGRRGKWWGEDSAKIKVDIDTNKSRSFQVFRDGIRKYIWILYFNNENRHKLCIPQSKYDV